MQFVKSENVETEALVGGAHEHVIKAFAEAVITGDKTKMVAEGSEGLNSVMLINATYLSSWKNKTVELPMDDDEFLEVLTEKRKAELEGK